MSKLNISNIGPIQTVEIDMDHKITIVAGRNGSGKSTIAKLLGMLQSGHDFGFFYPSWDKLLKKDAATLLFSGSKHGAASLGDAELSIKPTNYTIASGQKFLPVVCGQERWSTMASTRREAVLDAVFGINPTDDELRDLLQSNGAACSVLDVVEIGTMLTGLRQEWTARTGEKRYPESTAGSWLPPVGYNIELLKVNIETLQYDASLAKDAFLAVKDAGWIDEEEVARLHTIIDTHINTDLAEIERSGRENQAQIDKMTACAPVAPQRRPSQQIPLPSQPVPPTPIARKESKCAHCGIVLGCGCDGERADITNRERLAMDAQNNYVKLLAKHQSEVESIDAHNAKVVGWIAKYQADMSEWEAGMQTHNKKMAEFLARQNEIRQQYREARTVVDAQLAAKKRLEKMQSGVSKEQYSALDDAKTRSEAMLAAATTYQDALVVHSKIEGLKLAKKLLTENNLKGEKKKSAVAAINLGIATLTNNVGGQFGISQSLDVRHITQDHDTHTILSTGMTLVCDWLIQLAIGQIVGGVVVIDGLDLLKAPYSNIMMRAIDRADCKAFVTYADSNRLVQENFSGLDSSVAFYRLENGVATLEWEHFVDVNKMVVQGK